jgi:deazaflavin-dependent oxidoreductase (nitroreductase family)
MTFDTPNGTRGSRQPRSNRLMRWMNVRTINRIRRKGGRFMGMNALVLTTVGRKSGVDRVNPVAWFPGGGDSWLIVASAGGAPRNPAWYYNIAAHLDQVQVEVAGRKVSVSAEQLHGERRDEAWRGIVEASPRFAKYESKTDREIPVIRLNPRDT